MHLKLSVWQVSNYIRKEEFTRTPKFVNENLSTFRPAVWTESSRLLSRDLETPVIPRRWVVVEVVGVVTARYQYSRGELARAVGVVERTGGGGDVADDVTTATTRRAVGLTAVNQVTVVQRHLPCLATEQQQGETASCTQVQATDRVMPQLLQKVRNK